MQLLPTTAVQQDNELLIGNVSGAIEQNLPTVIKTMVNLKKPTKPNLTQP